MCVTKGVLILPSKGDIIWWCRYSICFQRSSASAYQLQYGSFPLTTATVNFLYWGNCTNFQPPVNLPFRFSLAYQLSLKSPHLTGSRNVDGMQLICQFWLFRRLVIERKIRHVCLGCGREISLSLVNLNAHNTKISFRHNWQAELNVDGGLYESIDEDLTTVKSLFYILRQKLSAMP